MTEAAKTEAVKESRIKTTLARLAAAKKPALVTYIMAGDPDRFTSLEIMKTLPVAGADIIELGMPFSDPMADGPVIQQAAIRSLAKKTNLKKVLEQLADFRKVNTTVPVVLMGYFNPIFKFGTEAFFKAAADAGADGVIIVDIPPEEDSEILKHAQNNNIDIIRLIAPTTNEARLEEVLRNASGFVYYISMTGITGTKLTNPSAVVPHIRTLKKHTKLPVAVGFGIKNAEQAQEIGKYADAVVVGSAIVDIIGKAAKASGMGIIQHKLVNDIFEFVGALSKGLKSAK